MDNRSRAIRTIRLFLVLSGVCIFIAIFTIAKKRYLVLSSEDAELISKARLRRANNLRYFEITNREGDFHLMASKAMLEKPYGAEGITATLEMKRGEGFKLTSGYANLEEHNNLIIFNDNVIIESSDGIKAFTNALHISTNGKSGMSPGEISIQGPRWHLTAGSMEEAALEEGGGIRATFAHGVKTIYYPGRAPQSSALIVDDLITMSGL